MKEIRKALNGRFEYKETELKQVLQQLYRHRRENLKNNQDSIKSKSEKKRKGTNFQRGDVRGNLYQNCDMRNRIKLCY